MSNIREEIIKEIRETVEIKLNTLEVKRCLDEYLDIKFGLKNVEYELSRYDGELVDINFKDSDLGEMLLRNYAIGGELIEEAILHELKANKNDRICVFYPEDMCTGFIGVTISPKILLRNI